MEGRRRQRWTLDPSQEVPKGPERDREVGEEERNIYIDYVEWPGGDLPWYLQERTAKSTHVDQSKQDADADNGVCGSEMHSLRGLE